MNLNNKVKNRFEISEILKKLLLKVDKLDNIDLSKKADLVGGKVPSSQLPSHVDNTYSTTETVIGTWIDGKPIYRRVYKGTATGGVYTVYGLHSINLKSFIDLKVLIKYPYTNNYYTAKEVSLPGINQLMVIPYSLASDYPYFEVRVYSNNISTPFTVDLAVIVEYTKTTD